MNHAILSLLKALFFLLIFIPYNAFLQSSCLPDGIMITSQQQIDDFTENYPGCTEIEGHLIIRDLDPQDIVNLDGLSQIESVGGFFQLRNNSLLNDISGLANLESVGGAIYLQENNLLTSFEGLNSLRTGGEYLFIGQHVLLESLDGLEGLIEIDGTLTIRANDKLSDINGIRNIDPTSVESPTPGTDVFIRDNPMLSECAVMSICGIIDEPGIATLFLNNSPGCNSRDEVVTACDQAFPCDQAPSQKDLANLIEFYHSTNGDEWRKNSGWYEAINEGGSCYYCNWYGVDCDENGRVICIDMDGYANCDDTNNFGIEMSGEIPPSIGDLDKLETFIVRHNELSNLPDEIAKLKNLKLLSIGYNNYSGEIPPAIYELENLEYLTLRDNAFSGSISPAIGNLKKLKELRSSRNQLTGSIPSEITELEDLRYISISQNQLSGPIPDDIGNLSMLEVFYISNNNLTGEIPASIGDLENLGYLSLSINQLSGEIPDNLWNLSNNTFFSIYANNLTGTLPTDFSGMEKLITLYLHENQLSGTIPESLGEISSLTTLRMGKNKFTGEMPASLANSLTNLQLNDNDLSGCVPQAIIDTFCLYGELEVDAFGKGITLIGNQQLPYEGIFDTLCSPMLDQIGAPCSDGDPSNGPEIIHPECRCYNPVHTLEFSTDKIAVKPNPAKNQIKIEGIDEQFYFSIKAIDGRTMANGISVNSTIDVQDLVNGVYILHLYSNKMAHQKTSKFIISR